MFYWLSDCGYIGVFDPSSKTWNILPVKPCPAKSGFMMENEGDIFVMTLRRNKNPWVFKLNFKRNVWEEKRKVGGLTVFASEPGSFTRAGLSAKERNRIYPSHNGQLGVYYLGDENSSHPPYMYLFV